MDSLKQVIMPVNRINENTPFGFNIIELGSLTVYTGKLRFKGIEYSPGRPYINVKYVRGYCIISFEVIDRELGNELYRVLARLAKGIAQSRLNEKWRWSE